MVTGSVLVTGAAGGIGRVAVERLLRVGHHVIATDRVERPVSLAAPYRRADLADPEQALTVMDGATALVHLAAIPDPLFEPRATLFANNAIACFNVVDAAARRGLRRVVYVSSETVLGFQFAGAAERRVPEYLPVDEAHPTRPEDAYGLSKLAGELIVEAFSRRHPDAVCVSLRPSWVHHATDYAAYWAPAYQDAYQGATNLWSYVDVHDVASAIELSLALDVPGHAVLLIAAADNILGAPLAELVRRRFGERLGVGPLPRPDASAISCRRAYETLGFVAARSFRDRIPRRPDAA